MEKNNGMGKEALEAERLARIERNRLLDEENKRDREALAEARAELARARGETVALEQTQAENLATNIDLEKDEELIEKQNNEYLNKKYKDAFSDKVKNKVKNLLSVNKPLNSGLGIAENPTEGVDPAPKKEKLIPNKSSAPKINLANQEEKLKAEKTTLSDALNKMAGMVTMEARAGEYLSPANLLDSSEEAKEVETEIKNLTEEEKEKLGWGLSTIGFKVEERKNTFFAKAFNLTERTELLSITRNGKTSSYGIGGLDKKSGLGRFLVELRDGFKRDAESALKKGLAVQKGEEKAKLKNTTFLLGNVLKYGRVITDLTGKSLASPLRYVMMGAMAFTRASEAGKEARLKNEEVIEKTRIQDADLAAEEAWKIYEKAKAKDSNVSAEALKKAYLLEMPADLQKRLKNPSDALGLVEWITKKDISEAVSRVNDNILKIEKNSKLTAEEKEAKKNKLIEKWSKSLADYDRIVTQYGTVDTWAMAGRYAQTAGKAVIAGLAVETIALSAEKLWSSISHLLTSHEALSIESSQITEKTSTATTGTAGGVLDQKEIVEEFPKIKSLDEIAKKAPGTVITEEYPPIKSLDEIAKEAPGVFKEIKPEAVIGRGEGIEHALRRQIESNEIIAKTLGWDGKEDLYKFSGWAAHKVALDKGYVDATTGEEIRIKAPGGQVAYELKPDGNGGVKVEEFEMRDGKFVSHETHGTEKTFEGDQKDSYEYRHKEKLGSNETIIKTDAVSEPLPKSTKTFESIYEDKSAVKPPVETAREEVLNKYDMSKAEEVDVDNAPKTYRVGQGNKLTDGTTVRMGSTVRTGTTAGMPGDKPHGINVHYNSRSFWGNVDKVYHFDHPTPEQSEALNNMLEHHPEFVENPYNLSGEKLLETYETHQSSLTKVFAEDAEIRWGMVKDYSAKDLMQTPTAETEEGLVSFIGYLKKLKELSGLDPKGTFITRKETSAEYIARALQRIESLGRTNQLKASLEKIAEAK